MCLDMLDLKLLRFLSMKIVHCYVRIPAFEKAFAAELLAWGILISACTLLILKIVRWLIGTRFLFHGPEMIKAKYVSLNDTAS